MLFDSNLLIINKIFKNNNIDFNLSDAFTLLLSNTETKNVKTLKVLESYWRTCGVQPFVRFCHGGTHSRRFAAFLKWDIWESGTKLLSLLLPILKFVLSAQSIDF